MMSYETWMADAGPRAHRAGNAATSTIDRYRMLHPSVSDRELAAYISTGERFRKPATSTTDAFHRLAKGEQKSCKRKRSRTLQPEQKYRNPDRISLEGIRHLLAQDFARSAYEKGESEYPFLLGLEEQHIEEMSDRQVRAIFLKHYNPDGTRKSAA